MRGAVTLWSDSDAGEAFLGKGTQPEPVLSFSSSFCGWKGVLPFASTSVRPESLRQAETSAASIGDLSEIEQQRCRIDHTGRLRPPRCHAFAETAWPCVLHLRNLAGLAVIWATYHPRRTVVGVKAGVKAGFRAGFRAGVVPSGAGLGSQELTAASE